MSDFRDDLTREQIEAALEALRPFYSFGAVLATAEEEKGHSWVALYDGEKEADEPEVFYDSINDESRVVGVSGGWSKVPATYIGPVLTAEDFKKARDAFLACVHTEASK